MPKRTLQQVADKHGITKAQLEAIGTKGVNKWNDAEVAEAVKNLRPKIQMDAKLKGKAKKAVSEAASKKSLKQLEEAAYSAQTYEEARLINEQLKGVKAAVAVKREMGELIKLSEIDERDTRIGAAMRAGLLKWTNDMPPALEGLTASQIKGKLTESVKLLLGDLADMQSEFWKDKQKGVSNE